MNTQVKDVPAGRLQSSEYCSQGTSSKLQSFSRTERLKRSGFGVGWKRGARPLSNGKVLFVAKNLLVVYFYSALDDDNMRS